MYVKIKNDRFFFLREKDQFRGHVLDGRLESEHVDIIFSISDFAFYSNICEKTCSSKYLSNSNSRVVEARNVMPRGKT